MKDLKLSDKICVPCTAASDALSSGQVQALLQQIGNSWEINDAGHIYAKFKFKNFQKAMDFANSIAVIANSQNHHPDLHIAWGLCGIEIWTHSINGLTESDFILAAKCDEAFIKSQQI